jgi:hypothetical protein
VLPSSMRITTSASTLDSDMGRARNVGVRQDDP